MHVFINSGNGRITKLKIFFPFNVRNSNSVNVLSCVSNHTKISEGAVRELRLELSALHHRHHSMKNDHGNLVSFKTIGVFCQSIKHLNTFYMVKYKWDNFIFSKIRFKNDDAVVLEILENYCAETLKHVKNLYDQTKYLKGVINMVSNLY